MKTRNFDAVIFDLDGVITQTADVHSKAWKRMFDEFMQNWSEKNGTPFKEFTHENDYLPYVDGKPRYKGVASFLESRGIDIPFGNPEDSTEKETVCGLGNRKNEKFNETLHTDGVTVFDSTVSIIKQLKEEDIRIGVASSSKNCKVVLEAAGLIDLFETRVDGVVSAELGLNGKPEADIFTTAADNLGVDYSKSIVVEDAVSGVQAGRNGRFGLVLGIAREENHESLKMNGADIVVSDMEEITLDDFDEWFASDLIEKQWSIEYEGYHTENEPTHEALLTVGNGYFGTRGALEETRANGINYPGTYIAGLYNRLKTPVGGRDVENEDFVNCPNWLPVQFKIDDGDWVAVNEKTIQSIYRKIDFRDGVLNRIMIVADDKGNETKITSQRLASMKHPHLAAMRYTAKPINYNGTLTFRTGIDGDIINDGVKRYRELNQQHLKPSSGKAKGNIQMLEAETTQSGIKIAEAVKLNFPESNPEITHDEKPAQVFSSFSKKLEMGESYSFEKVVTIFTSRELEADGDVMKQAVKELEKASHFDTIAKESRQEWN
ncbi:MAG TPA: beta-phosphoglucomutase family hydrolase, partial [Bacteroidales bacterium]|nr:beta-phosphoglucomutase family hydrolase [Bacteroidales bacterium]